MQHGTVKNKQSMAPSGCCFPSPWGFLLFCLFFWWEGTMAKSENSGLPPSWVWSFLKLRQGNDFTGCQHEGCGTLALWDFGRTYPSAKVGPGERCGNGCKGTWAQRQSRRGAELFLQTALAKKGRGAFLVCGQFSGVKIWLSLNV